MSTKKDPMDDYRKIKNELVVDRVDGIFRNHPDQYIQEFYDATEPDGYDALFQLQELFPLDTEKGRIVAFFAQEMTKQSGPDDIGF